MNNQSRIRSTLWITGLGSVVLLGLYIWFYSNGPLTAVFNASAGTTWNDFMTNLLTVAAAGFSAVIAILVMHCYRRDEPVFMIWMFFAIGLWIWTAAEITFMIINLTAGEVPVPSLADGFWIITYFFFTVAFIRQYTVIYRPSMLRRILIALIGWLAILALTFLVAFLANGMDIAAVTASAMVNYFYPVADFAIALVAIYFIITFQRGALTRPWLGLFAFAVADTLYAWLYESGLLTFTSASINTISMFADTIYVAAYLVLAFGLLMHLLLVKYGPSALISPKLGEATRT